MKWDAAVILGLVGILSLADVRSAEASDITPTELAEICAKNNTHIRNALDAYWGKRATKEKFTEYLTRALTVVLDEQYSALGIFTANRELDTKVAVMRKMGWLEIVLDIYERHGLDNFKSDKKRAVAIVKITLKIQQKCLVELLTLNQ